MAVPMVWPRLRDRFVNAAATPYEERGAAFFDRLDTGKQARYHLRRLAELGYAVPDEPTLAA